jgi:preprotein translocase subunit SecE
VRNTTIITVIAVIFFAAYLWGVDRAFAFLIEQLQRLLGGA